MEQKVYDIPHGTYTITPEILNTAFTLMAPIHDPSTFVQAMRRAIASIATVNQLVLLRGLKRLVSSTGFQYDALNRVRVITDALSSMFPVIGCYNKDPDVMPLIIMAYKLWPPNDTQKFQL